MRLLLAMLLVLPLLAGCRRAYYREQADRESYAAIEERNQDLRWALPRISVQPAPESRLHDPYDPDRPPIPPDDPTAHTYMHSVNGMPGYRKWHRDGDAPSIEDPQWLALLPVDSDGTLPLTPERAVEIGLLHSREYQTQIEEIYRTALVVTFQRFQFAMQWFATNATSFAHSGSGSTDTNTLTNNSHLGFTRAFAAGGQLIADFANSVVFQYSGTGQTTVTSNIFLTLIQPLLRHGGRAVQLEELTESERVLLYRVREFARFRKQYSFDIATDRYLKLLAQVQGIRNQRDTLAKFENNLRLHEALRAIGEISSVKVEQVDLNVQEARRKLIKLEADLETALDAYMIQLGLPPRIPPRLDEKVLAPFQLTDPALDALQGGIDRFLAEYRELDAAPPLAKLRDGFKKLEMFHAQITRLTEEVQGELKRWRQTLETPDEDAERRRRALSDLADRTQEMDELTADLKTLKQANNKAAAALAEVKRKEGWETLQDQAREISSTVSQLFIIQTQVRVHLLTLPKLDYDRGAAVQYAFANRLDLMNQRAIVVDVWRQITVTANGLETGLDVKYTGNIGTPPTGNRPFDFRASASNHSVGVFVDGPLNRVAERNDYRASQIAYQKARRDYMELEDKIEREVRLDLRRLRVERLNFEIARRSLISAARQAEGSRMELYGGIGNPDPTSTQNLLIALNALLTAKNDLISSWVNFETARLQLLLDLEALQLDDKGLYREESIDLPSGTKIANNSPVPSPP